MMTQVINILFPFLTFASTYNHTKPHNILAIMLNLHLKNMKVIWDSMGNALAIQIVARYDTNIVCLFLLHVFFYLNLVRATIELMAIENYDFFGGRLYQVMM
jgi:hypothetical protein